MQLQNVKMSNLCNSPEIDSRGGKAPVDDLIQSIKERGLIQPLAVRATECDGEYEIIAGHRRFEAMRIIYGSKNPEVPCVVLKPTDDAEALELSTMENVLRKRLHPVEEYDAYARLVAQGVTVEGIAKRFAAKERWVRQRLQLQRLAPSLREAWRKGEMSTEQAEAFTCSDDHAAQERVWEELQKRYGEYSKRPDSIRRELEDDGYSADDVRVALIGGLDAYRAAGGRVKEDLFLDFATLIDGDIVDKLVAEKLEARCAELRAEGWSFAAVQGNYYPDEIDLTPWMTPDERAEEESRGLVHDKMDAVRERAKADPAARAQSGVIVSVDNEGIAYEYLMEPKEPEPERKGDDQGEDKPAPVKPDPGPPPEPEPAVNHPLVQAMSEHLTLAMSDVIATEPHVANAALAATLKVAMAGSANSLPFRLATHSAWDALTGGRSSKDEASEWVKAFQEYRKFPAVMMADELGKLAAKLFDVRVIRFDSSRDSIFPKRRGALLNAIAGELPAEKLTGALDKHFDREGYFRKLTIAKITETLGAMGRKDGIPKDKAALVKLATQVAKEKGWLPPEMRLPGVKALGAPEKAAAAAPKAKATRKGK